MILGNQTSVVKKLANPMTGSSITVTGTLTTDGVTPAVIPELFFWMTLGGYPVFRAYTDPANTFANYWELIRILGNWHLRFQLNNMNTEHQWASINDALSPELANWTGSAQAPATGDPVLTLNN